jgi:riboflavin biosynthesis pyrimidine reductase
VVSEDDTSAKRSEWQTAGMRLLMADGIRHSPGASLDDAALAEVYAPPPEPWLRVNFVSTLDGAAAGPDGRTGSINTPADHVVFALLRRLSDVVVVGAGTVRDEGYGRLGGRGGHAPTLAVVTNSGLVPEKVLQPVPGRGDVLVITREKAPAANLARMREALGEDGVVLAGRDSVDLRLLRASLEERGLHRMLSEGGPMLMAGMLAAGLVDELDLTWAPSLIGGAHPRITTGGALDVTLEPMVLVESGGTVMGRWRVVR